MAINIPPSCEDPILPKLMPYFEGKGTFLDIGSSDGWYTYMAATTMGEGSKIIGFEPVPWIFEKYQNLFVSSWSEEEWYKNKKIECHNNIVSKESGETVRLYKFEGHSGIIDPSAFFAHFSTSTLPQHEHWDISTVKIDDFLNSSDTNVLIKIDVEGHELEVVQGGVEYFSNCSQCTVFLELHAGLMLQQQQDPLEVVHFFEELGYVETELANQGAVFWNIYERE